MAKAETPQELIFPTRDELLALYTPKEADLLDRSGKALASISDKKERSRIGREIQRKLWPDELEYISKTHWIATKESGMKLMKPNYAQVRFYKDCIVAPRAKSLPIRAIILKARQLGFSTFIQCWQFEQCDRNSNRNSMTVSYDDVSTEELFVKSRTIRDWQWFPRESRRERKSTIEFARPHGSTFYTRTAGNASVGRGITLHHVHCSEVPMWPDPESVMGAVQQSVPTKPNTSIIWESTARGAMGLFYDAWGAAESGESDTIPFFAPWFWDPEYSIPFANTDEENAFMRNLSVEDRDYQRAYKLTSAQMRWRSFKIRNELNGSVDIFRQEFPACAEEAFLTTGKPVFNPNVVRNLQDNVTAPRWVGDILLTPK